MEMNFSELQKMFSTIALASLLILTVSLSAQTPHPILRYFTANVIDGQVRLSWVVFGGSTCNGIIIERSSDGAVFEAIGDIAGICGSPDADIPYVFLDENPVSNQVNYYRLELGTQGYSTPIAINFVPLNSDGYNLRLENGGTSASIFFSNENRETANVGLYDAVGRSVYQSSTQESFISIPLNSLPAGIYIFRILVDGSQVSGKFFSQ
jgi:hypothetical protein